MRVVTSNLQHGVPDPQARPALGRAVAPLSAMQADVYALQELDRGRFRTACAHQGARLAGALGGELVWGRAKHWLWAAQANALVVRGEVLTSEVIRLPGGGERRVAVLATVVVGGLPWSIASTHLSLERAVARRQLDAVLDALSDGEGPHVVLGDLNLQAKLVEPIAVAAGYELLAGPPTVNARTTPDRRLDHVLVRGATVVDSGVAKLPVSDHLAVWADLR